MTTLVERMARSDAEFDGRTFDFLGRADRKRYLARSLAALRAMRTPTEMMIEVGSEQCRGIDIEHGPFLKADEYRDDAANVFTVMIDAAIQEAEA